MPVGFTIISSAPPNSSSSSFIFELTFCNVSLIQYRMALKHSLFIMKSNFFDAVISDPIDIECDFALGYGARCVPSNNVDSDGDDEDGNMYPLALVPSVSSVRLSVGADAADADAAPMSISSLNNCLGLIVFSSSGFSRMTL